MEFSHRENYSFLQATLYVRAASRFRNQLQLCLSCSTFVGRAPCASSRECNSGNCGCRDAWEAARLQLRHPKGGRHDRKQALRVVSVHPVAGIMQEVDAVAQARNHILILHVQYANGKQR